MNFGIDVGKRIKSLKESCKFMSAEEFAKKCQMSESTMYNAFKGELTVQTLVSIAKANNVTLDYLLGNDEVKNHEEQCLKFVLKHAQPRICHKTVGTDKYVIPVVRFSKPLRDAYKIIREQEGTTKTNDSELTVLNELSEWFFDSDIENLESSALEYVLIPLKTLDNRRILEDVGIMPESDKDIV